ncbi:CREB-regulated transcription coactivator 1, partial [Calypte anna]
QLQAQKLRLAHSRGPYYSGSLPNVNQLGSGVTDFQGPLQSPLDSTRGTRHHGLVERVQRDPRRMIMFPPLPISNPIFPSHFFTPLSLLSHPLLPFFSSSHSFSPIFSALFSHSLLPFFPPLPVSHPTFPPLQVSHPIFPPLPGSHPTFPPLQVSHPIFPPLPGSHPTIFPSPDQPAAVPLIPSALNTGGSLPDLTNLHFPSPLPTPLDPDETPLYPNLSGGSSTTNLATTMTHLGISG